MSVLDPSDVRRFYAELGIELPAWADRNAAVRCFADPGAHAHDDHRPSCSVSLENGAWCCHGCGARGGAYDAALARGHDPRSAIELMITHRLTERREAAARRPRSLGPALAHVAASTRPPARPAPPAALAVTEADVQRWRHALHSDQGRGLRARLARDRGWTAPTLAELDLGYDGRRLTIPIRDGAGQLTGVLHYRLDGAGPKMLASPGSRLGLIPHPAREPAKRILLVEGPPDMLSARSRGWPAIAVPGATAWRPEWAQLLKDRAVTVVMDSDPPGRAAAQRIATDLQPLAGCPGA